MFCFCCSLLKPLILNSLTLCAHIIRILMAAIFLSFFPSFKALYKYGRRSIVEQGEHVIGHSGMSFKGNGVGSAWGILLPKEHLVPSKYVITSVWHLTEVALSSSGSYWLEIMAVGKICQGTGQFPEQGQTAHAVSSWEILLSDWELQSLISKRYSAQKGLLMSRYRGWWCHGTGADDVVMWGWWCHDTGW